MTSCVYAVTNLVNGKRYIGSSINFEQRSSMHLRQLRCGIHHSIKLQRAWDKYGAVNFKFEVLEVVQDTNLLITREQIWIDKFSAAAVGYNILPIAGSSLGSHRTDATKLKISLAKKGVKQGPMLTMTKLKISASCKGRQLSTGMLGNFHSTETKLKMSLAAQGRTMGEETKLKLADINKGRKLSEATKQKLSRLHKGRRNSETHNANIAKARTGVKHSEEAKLNMSLARKLSYLNLKTKNSLLEIL